MKKTLILSVGILGCLVQSASAQVSLFTTTNDFGQFNGGAGNVNSLYYSDSSTVNGVGNTVSPGGAGADRLAPVDCTRRMERLDWLARTFRGLRAAVFLRPLPQVALGHGAPNRVMDPATLWPIQEPSRLTSMRGNFTDWSWFGHQP